MRRRLVKTLLWMKRKDEHRSDLCDNCVQSVLLHLSFTRSKYNTSKTVLSRYLLPHLSNGAQTAAYGPTQHHSLSLPNAAPLDYNQFG